MARAGNGQGAAPRDLRHLLRPPGVVLTKQQRRIADFLLLKPEVASYATAQHVASELGVDPSTIVRYAQAIGFRGYPALQEVARDLHLGYPRSTEPVEHSDLSVPVAFPVATIDRELRNIELLRSTVDQAAIDRAVLAIANARQSVILASGSYGALALVLEHLGRLLGYNVSLENRETWHAGARVAALTAADLLIYISFWWIDKDHLQMVSWARQRHVPLVVISNRPHLELMGDGVEMLVTPARGRSFYSSLVAPLTLIYSIVERLEAVDPERSQAALESAQVLYEALNLSISVPSDSLGRL